MITRQQALELLHSHLESVNLRKHCYSVEAVMRALARYFKEDEEKWGIVGLLHDGDYEQTKEDIASHAKLMAGWVKELGETDEELLTGIESHGWFHEGKLPKTKMQWALYCCDELTGFIIAVTLVRPEKSLSLVKVEHLLKKWPEKSFAAGVKREEVEQCEAQLHIPIKEFMTIALEAMQGISQNLGL